MTGVKHQFTVINIHEHYIVYNIVLNISQVKYRSCMCLNLCVWMLVC